MGCSWGGSAVRTTKWLSLLSVAVIGIFMMAACGPSRPAQTGAPAASQSGDWRSDWDRAVAGARQEGTLRVISGSSSTNNIPNFEKYFADTTGGKVEFTELRAPDIISRLPEEYAARQHNWDIILLGGSSGISERLDQAGVLGNLNEAFIYPDITKDETWVGGFGDIWVDNDTKMYKIHHQAELSQGSQWWVNRQVLPESRFNKLEDVFTIPELKGKICTFDPRVEGASDANFGQIAGMYGADMVRRLYRDLDMVVLRDYGKLTQDTLHGACLISVGARIQDLHAEGVGLHIQPFSVFNPGVAPEYAGKLKVTCCGAGKNSSTLDGWVGGGSAYTMLAIAKDPPNPNAAKVFVNWLLSKEGQMTWPNPDRETSCSRRVDLQEWCNTTWKQGARGKDFVPLKADGSYVSIHTRSNFFIRITAQELGTEVFGR
jgi:hypothetical protein